MRQQILVLAGVVGYHPSASQYSSNRMITGFNHLTIAVSNLERSFNFYVDLLGCTPEARWNDGAYLSAGGIWICLSLGIVAPAGDYTHYAFSIEHKSFNATADRLLAMGATTWKENSSEGDSLYFLDPDGHKLELHAGNLESRISFVDSKKYAGWVRFK